MKRYYWVILLLNILSFSCFGQEYGKIEATKIDLKNRLFGENIFIGKAVLGSNIILSENELGILYDLRQTDLDTIKLQSPHNVLVVYKDTYRNYSFSTIIKQKQSDNFSEMQEGVSLYQLHELDLTDAVGVILTSSKEIKVKNFRTKTAVIDSDTISGCGEQIRYIEISLRSKKEIRIQYVTREAYAKVVIDDLFMPDEKRVYLIIDKKYYETSMYWKGQNEYNGY